MMRRDEMIVRATNQPGIHTASWRRRTDKKENRCPTCNAQVKRHNRQWVCDDHGVVGTNRVTIENAGDLVTRTFIAKIKPTGTKNWSPTLDENGERDGFCFNANSQAEVDEIKQRKGLIQVLKMGGVGDDPRGVPITIPAYDIESFNGQEIVD